MTKAWRWGKKVVEIAQELLEGGLVITLSGSLLAVLMSLWAQVFMTPRHVANSQSAISHQALSRVEQA